MNAAILRRITTVFAVMVLAAFVGCAGIAHADVTGEGSPSLTAPTAKVKRAGGCRFAVSWNQSASHEKVFGYVIRYSASKDMANAKNKVVKGAAKTHKTIIIGKDRKSAYYVQVRSYKKTAATITRSAWSKAKKVKLGTAKNLKKKAGVKKNYHKSLYHGKKGAKYQRYIVLHDTEGLGSPDNVISYWVGNGNLVAAHLTIGRDGSVSQCVPLDAIAHHAGYGNTGHNKQFGIKEDGRDDMRKSKPIGSQAADYGMNAWSVGIEMVHVHGQGYTTAQLKKLDQVIAWIDAYYGFESTITDHKAWRQGNSDTDSTFKTYFDNYKKYRSYKKPSY